MVAFTSQLAHLHVFNLLQLVNTDVNLILLLPLYYFSCLFILISRLALFFTFPFFIMIFYFFRVDVFLINIFHFLDIRQALLFGCYVYSSIRRVVTSFF